MYFVSFICLQIGPVMTSTILRCTLILGIWTSVCKHDVKATVWRKSLQKEVLLNSIQYLRGQLFVCLKATPGGRGKVSTTSLYIIMTHKNVY
jgi:hypothetical protein